VRRRAGALKRRVDGVSRSDSWADAGRQRRIRTGERCAGSVAKCPGRGQQPARLSGSRADDAL